jgi:hypothetical protein
MMHALKETRSILKQAKGVFLVESNVRYRAELETTYTVTAYWTSTHFYVGNDFNAAEQAFGRAVARAPARVR